jgi:hypothetical protein
MDARSAAHIVVLPDPGRPITRISQWRSLAEPMLPRQFTETLLDRYRTDGAPVQSVSFRARLAGKAGEI